MQAELEAEHPDLSIRLLAINAEGLESSNELIFAEGDLPLLQDDDANAVWSRWEAEWRDVIVVDQTNEAVRVFNLTTYGLSDASNYDALKALLVAAAQGEDIREAPPDSGE